MIDWIAVCGKKNNKFPAHKIIPFLCFIFDMDTVVSPLKSQNSENSELLCNSQKKDFSGRQTA